MMCSIPLKKSNMPLKEIALLKALKYLLNSQLNNKNKLRVVQKQRLDQLSQQLTLKLKQSLSGARKSERPMIR